MILKAMAKSPDDRFQTVGEMVSALDAAVRLAQAAPWPEEMMSAPPVAQEDAPPSARPPGGAVAKVRQATRTGWGRIAMWAVIGVVAVLATYLVLSRVPLQVQIRGGQLELVRLVEGTAAPEALGTEVAAKPAATRTPQPTATAAPQTSTAHPTTIIASATPEASEPTATPPRFQASTATPYVETASSLPRLVVTADGDPSEWEGIPFSVTDPAGDTGGRTGDIAGLAAAIDGEYLCLMLAFHDSYPADKQVNWFCVHAVDDPYCHEFRVAEPGYELLRRGRHTEGGAVEADAAGLLGGAGEVIELKVPISSIGSLAVCRSNRFHHKNALILAKIRT